MIKLFKGKCREISWYIHTQERNNYDENNKDHYMNIIENLDLESRRILHNDFVVRESRDWYMSYYSKSTYYRLKNIALDKFISYIS